MSALLVCLLVFFRASCIVMFVGLLTGLYYDPADAILAALVSFVIALIASLPLSCLTAFIVHPTFSLPYKFVSCLVAFIIIAVVIPATIVGIFLTWMGQQNIFESFAVLLFMALPILSVSSFWSKKDLRHIYDQQQLAAGAHS